MAQEEFQDRTDQARETLNSWVAQFVPLVMGTEALDLNATRARLDLAERLRSSAEEGAAQIAHLDAISDGELISTFRAARSQISSIENDLRARLGKLSPGDPESRADLGELQDRLAETAAKIELGVDTVTDHSGVFEAVTSPSNYAAGIGMFVFGLGWNAFTTFHATLMIGGMYKAFGPGALAMLLFYAIFFFAGFGMWASAFVSAAEESVTLEGNRLTVRRKLGFVKLEKTHVIDESAMAYIGNAVSALRENKSGGIPSRAVILTDTNGRPVNIALSTTDAKRKALCEQINARLQAFGVRNDAA